jgi:hypothetical protein
MPTVRLENWVTTESVSGSSSSQVVGASSALEKLAEEIQRVQESDLIHINIDVVAAVTTALGIMPKLGKLRPEIEKLPSFNLSLVDNFEVYAMALYETHADYLSATRPKEPLPKLVEEGTKLRDLLYTDAQALIQRELIDGQEIREVKTAIGHKALAVDLTLLSDALQRKWDVLQSKTALTLEELLRAQQLATALLRVVGEREQAPAVAADAAANRARAFALFMRAYDEVRRAVTFLRWKEGDWDLIAPSLYAGRSTGKRKPEAETPTPEPTPVPGEAGSVEVAPTASGVVTAPAQTTAPIGFPDSDPFSRS